MAGLDESLTVLLERVVLKTLKVLRAHLPGTVESFDKEKGTADIRVDLGEYIKVQGVEEAEFDDLLVNVPVEWPGGGGARAAFPLKRGDQGLLSFHDRALDEWKANATGAVLPRFMRLHDVADATFAPGLRRPAAPWRMMSDDAVTFGFDGSAGTGVMMVFITPTGIALGEETPPYSVALAEKTNQRLAALEAAFNAHVHATAATGPPVPPTPVPGSIPVAGPGGSPVVGSVASTSVKVKG